MSDRDPLFDIIESRDRLVSRLHAVAIRGEALASERDDAASLARLRGERIDELQGLIRDVEVDRDYWKTQCATISLRIDELQRLVYEVEVNRDYWKTQCELLAPRIDTLQRAVKDTETDRDYWKQRAGDI